MFASRQRKTSCRSKSAVLSFKRTAALPTGMSSVLCSMRSPKRFPYVRGFPFSHPEPQQYTPPARSKPQLCAPDASAPSGSQVCAFGMESTGTVDPFPMRFLGHLAIPPACFPGFLLPVADPTPRATAATRSALSWPRRVAASDGSRPAAASNTGRVSAADRPSSPTAAAGS
jgi:hypothetical protein